MPGKNFREQLRWLSGHWRLYRSELPVLVLLTLANAGALVTYPVLIKRVVEGIEGSLSRREIIEGVGLLAVVGVLQFGIYVWLQTLRARLNIRFDYGVRMRAFEHLLRMGPSFFGRFRTGDIVTRLTDDISMKLSWYMCSGFLRTLEAFTIIVFGAVMMLRLNPTLTAYAAGPLPVLVGLFVLVGERVQARHRRVQQSISSVNEALENCFSGIRVVKAFTAEPYQRRLVGGAIEGQRQAEIRAVRWQTVVDSLYGHVWQFATVGVLLAGGHMAIDGRLSLGELVAFDSYVLLLVWPMFDVGNFLVRGRLSAVSIDRISELEETMPDVRSDGDAPPPARRPDGEPIADAAGPRGHAASAVTVRFESVGYTYPGAAEPALRELSLEARPGTLTALVGEIGSGKSTAMAVVPRLIDPSAGRVIVGGRDVRSWPLDELRGAIGYVPQEPVLFSTTVEENIRLGRGWLSDDDVSMAIGASRLGPDVAIWADGLATRVGSRGIRLSGGQKQRVALARALAGRPSILLLDDCTASLDAETEDEVWRAIVGVLPSCVTLVVTHRPATLERAHHIVVLERGRPVEAGDFAALVRLGTRFSSLYVRWKLESEPAPSGSEAAGA